MDSVFDGVTGGALYVADNGTFLTEQGIQQGTFAYIWSTDDGYRYAVLQGIASMEGVGQTGDVGINLLCQCQQFCAVSEFQVLMVGESSSSSSNDVSLSSCSRSAASSVDMPPRS